jgi:hypothetical protein
MEEAGGRRLRGVRWRISGSIRRRFRRRGNSEVSVLNPGSSSCPHLLFEEVSTFILPSNISSAKFQAYSCRGN